MPRPSDVRERPPVSVCVGGPIDGRRIRVRGGATRYVASLPGRHEPWGPPEDPSAPPIVRVVTYVPTDVPGVFAPEGLSLELVLDLLVDGYRGAR